MRRNLRFVKNNSWAVANICCSCDLSSIDTALIAKLLSISLKYADSTKEKIISNSARALGYILSRCDERALIHIFKQINSDKDLLKDRREGQDHSKIADEEVTVKSIISILLDKAQDPSSKISWNAWVSIKNILCVDHIRKFDCGMLFSKRWIDLLLDIIWTRPNFKTKIQAARTLANFNSFKEYSGWYFEVFENVIVNFQKLCNVRDYSEYNYIEKLELRLVELSQHLLKWAIDDSSATKQMSDFLLVKADVITSSFSSAYLHSRLLATTPSSSRESTDGRDESDDENDDLREKLKRILQSDVVFKEIRTFMHMLKEYITQNEDIHIKFSQYQEIVSFSESQLDDLVANFNWSRS